MPSTARTDLYLSLLITKTSICRKGNELTVAATYSPHLMSSHLWHVKSQLLIIVCCHYSVANKKSVSIHSRLIVNIIAAQSYAKNGPAVEPTVKLDIPQTPAGSHEGLGAGKVTLIDLPTCN